MIILTSGNYAERTSSSLLQNFFSLNSELYTLPEFVKQEFLPWSFLCVWCVCAKIIGALISLSSISSLFWNPIPWQAYLMSSICWRSKIFLETVIFYSTSLSYLYLSNRDWLSQECSGELPLAIFHTWPLFRIFWPILFQQSLDFLWPTIPHFRALALAEHFLDELLLRDRAK